MLKCPRCGVRVKGPDLLTGICSACQQRLSVSESGDFQDGAKTFISSEGVSPGELGSSLESSDPQSPSDSAAKLLSASLDQSFDLGLTPAVGADGVNDRDTATLDSGMGSDQSSESAEEAQTYISDDWVEAPPAAPATPSASSDATIERTIAADLEYDANRTQEGDVVHPGDPEAGQRTLNEDLRAQVNRIDRTIMQDVSEAVADDRTISGTAFTGNEAAADKTFISDEVPEALLKTLQSNFDDGESSEQPTRTIKGKERDGDTDRIKSPKSTLIIKTRQLRDMQVAGPGTGKDPEYELLKVLGEGGMGVVFDARQTSIDRNVALKMIKGAAAKSEKQQAKFLAEAVVTGDLDHPNIVPIYDVGRNDQGALFYSMKKVSGTPWDQVIDQKTVAENVEILLRVADAVAFAHARGVVHRDLKPENTMLGEFGEVLVMDWGLAQPSRRFRKSSSITETSTMGGTPAYMAPEMATGPLERISHLSDIYLLGAILFEILTGRPPHTGKNAMKCLMAAARNEITPTEKTGELIDIARKAMQTDPAMRYQDVRAFQTAIREYQSHSESILLSTRAEEDLEEAKLSDDYQAYAKALFGFQEAYDLWAGNQRARAGIHMAELAYAESARRKGDFDLGLSLLDATQVAHEELRKLLKQDKQEREARLQRIAMQRKMLYGVGTAFVAAVTIGLFWVSYEAERARAAEKVAREEKDAADVAREKEELAKQDAIGARDLAEQKRIEAEESRLKEELAKKDAESARDLAETKRQEAEQARKLEEIAKRKEEYEAYIAEIGLAAAKINENAFESSRTILENCTPSLRNWEWGRLMHLCSQSMQTIAAKAPLDSLAVSPDGTQAATGGWDGFARIWNLSTGQLVHELRHGGLYVHSVAFSPDGQTLATGSDDPTGYVQLWNCKSGERTTILDGHADAVLSVAFSHDGQRLLTSSYDKTARVWKLADPSRPQVLSGHTWWVWQAAFSPDDSRAVTVSQDATALVWDLASGKPSPPFTGHQGPVYCATFTQDGERVITGGYDHRLLTWNPATLKPFEFRKLEEGAAVEPQPEYQLLGTHSTSIRCLNLSSDGQFLLSGGQDNTVRLWNLTTNSVVQTFRGHDSWVRGVAFGHDGRTLVTASQDATVRTWSIAGYEELRSIQGRELSGHADAVLAAAFSPNQAHVVTASRDRTARTWNSLTGQREHVFTEGHAFLASSAIFFDQGRKLVTAAVDNTTRIWDVATGTELHHLDRTGRSAALAISSDGRLLVTGGDQRQAQLWDPQTGQRLRSFDGHLAEVTAAAISPDGRWLLTGDAKGHGRIWQMESGELLHSLKAHTSRIGAAAWLPDGSRALLASSDKTVSQWDPQAGLEITKDILKHPDSVLTMVLSPEGDRVITSCADRIVRVWNRESLEVEQTFGPFPELIHSLSIAADGQRLLTAHAEERAVRLWDLTTGQELKSPKGNGGLGPLLDVRRMGGQVWAAIFAPGDEVLTVGGSDARLWDTKSQRERITFSPHAAVASAHYSPDGRWIVTGSWDNSAKIWNAESGLAVVKLDGAHQGFVNSAVFSPDGQYVLTASDDGTAKLWQVVLPADNNPEMSASATVVRTFTGHTDRVRTAIFSPQGDAVLTTSDDKTARLMALADGKLLQEFTGHEWSVLSADFSPDGRFLITGSEDNSAKVWNVGSGACLLTLSGHTAPVASVAFAPDGARVITGSQDQTAKLWDAKTGKEVLTLNRHTDDVTSVSFSPDGRQVLTSSRDGTAVIWLTVDWTPPPGNMVSRSLGMAGSPMARNSPSAPLQMLPHR
ncbi:protein kinase [bacterium]|nr:protein kinase [bacterium]